ncbi:Voltage-gated hydrogen channel 1 [Desmophyllum pertusum]|uniref:Voltage-gated hydrogen channel 1 n=1 Tax=Desmophyllum pertusum TaxID=174260 RepID=A0A9W9ZMI2_9CNID|nr:Voltage-gated hydrogen channel 1 [Desmophyllum pertusum]
MSYTSQVDDRLASVNTDTEDSSDGSDEDNRPTRLASDKRRKLSPEKHRNYNEVALGLPEGDTNDALVHSPANANVSPKAISRNTKHTRGVPSSGETAASPGARAYSPEEESDLFSTDYVDKLVASFWSKVDQKIEAAVSHHQPSPQAGQQTNTQDNAQIQDTDAEDKTNDKTCPLTKYPGGVCVFIVFIFQEWFTDGMWRQNLRGIITHRHANFTVVMVTLMNCFLVIANILADFDVIDDKGIEFIFTGFLYINLVIMFTFVLECFLRIIVLQRELFQDKMEIFDVALVWFYFLVELISSNGFSFHFAFAELQQEKEAAISAMESQTPR